MTFKKTVRNSTGVAIAIGAAALQLMASTATAQTLQVIQPANVAAPGTYIPGYGSAGYYPNLPVVNANPRLVEFDNRTDTINYSPQTGRSKGNIFYSAPINRNLVDPTAYLESLSPAHRAQYDMRAIGYAGARQLDTQNRRSGYRIITGAQGAVPAAAAFAPVPQPVAVPVPAPAPVVVAAPAPAIAQGNALSSSTTTTTTTNSSFYEGQTGMTASGQHYIIKRINGRLVRVIRYPVPVQVPYGMTLAQYEAKYGIKFGQQQAYQGSGQLVNSYTAGYQNFNVPSGYNVSAGYNNFGAAGGNSLTAPITVQEYRLP